MAYYPSVIAIAIFTLYSLPLFVLAAMPDWKIQWIKTSELSAQSAKSLETRQAPDAWDNCVSCGALVPGFLVRLTIPNDTSHVPGFWIPKLNDKIHFSWNGEYDNRIETRDQHSTFKVEVLKYSSPALSWVLVYDSPGSSILSVLVNAVSVGSLKDGRLVYPCRGFHSDAQRKLIIGRLWKRPRTNETSGGCIVYDYGNSGHEKEKTLKVFEMLEINMFGAPDDKNHDRGIYTTSDYCIRGLCPDKTMIKG